MSLEFIPEGEKLGDRPVPAPTKFELVINLRPPGCRVCRSPLSRWPTRSSSRAAFCMVRKWPAAAGRGSAARCLQWSYKRTVGGHGKHRRPSRSSRGTSLRLDARFANDSAEVIILLAEKSSKICAAHPNRKEPLCDKLWLDLGRLQRCAEPAAELGDRFLRRSRRSKHAERRGSPVTCPSADTKSYPSFPTSDRGAMTGWTSEGGR